MNDKNFIYCVSWYNKTQSIWVLVQHSYKTLLEAHEAAQGIKNSFDADTQILCKLNHYKL